MLRDLLFYACVQPEVNSSIHHHKKASNDKPSVESPQSISAICFLYAVDYPIELPFSAQLRHDYIVGESGAGVVKRVYETLG